MIGFTLHLLVLSTSILGEIRVPLISPGRMVLELYQFFPEWNEFGVQRNSKSFTTVQPVLPWVGLSDHHRFTGFITDEIRISENSITLQDQIFIGFSSELLNAVGSILIIPPSDHHVNGEVVFGPNSLNEFCAFSPTYWNPASEPNISSLILGDEPPLTLLGIQVHLNTGSERTKIPHEWFSVVSGMIIANSCSPNTIEFLPKISLNLGGAVGIELHAIDYVKIDPETNNCEILFESHEDRSIEIGTGILSQFIVIIDQRPENRIGFCDPLIH